MISLFSAFFRHNGDCAHEITALAISAVPMLMANVISLPTGLLDNLLTSLLKTTKVCTYRKYIYFTILAQILSCS